MALDWRAGFFEEIHCHFEQSSPQEGIDVTQRRVLDRLLEERVNDQQWDDRARTMLVAA
jgi:hypothetical protein